MSAYRSRKMKSKLNRVLEVPEEVTSKAPKLTILNFEEVLIENYKGILEYQDFYVRIQTYIGIVNINGFKLSLEEIFSTNILDRNAFGQLSYKYIGRHMTKVEYSKVFSHYELLLADIIEVQLSEQQENLFRDLMKENSDKYIFATAEQINSLGVECKDNQFNDNIANHTPKILNENIEKLIQRKKYKDIIKIPL